jgi:uncharacterized membrane protein (UPF0127 family)
VKRLLLAGLGLLMFVTACDEGEATLQATATATNLPAVSTSTPPGSPSATPADGLIAIEIQGTSASVTVRVELAVTEDEVRTGLMHRESLPEDRGMLFIFDPPSHTGFWMRNTLIPLDIAYIDADGTIKEIVHGEPLNETVLRPTLPYWYVLEVNGGWFERQGLGVGDRAVIPVDLDNKQ